MLVFFHFCCFFRFNEINNKLLMSKYCNLLLQFILMVAYSLFIIILITGRLLLTAFWLEICMVPRHILGGWEVVKNISFC